MSEFKFKVYEKINGDDHISYRLMEQHEKAPQEISEKQLDKYRASESEVITEKLLDKNRKDDDHLTTEGRLNAAKDQFGVKHRNASTYEGDINKLEEQRLAKKKNEEEKYKSSSETPKALKWWDVKSPDGLKVASVNASANDSANDSANKKDYFEQMYKQALNYLYVGAEAEEDDNDLEDVDPSQFTSAMKIIDNQILKEGSIPELYMVLQYNPTDLGNDWDLIREVALAKVAEEKPEISKFLSPDDFYVSPENKTVVLDVFGKQYDSEDKFPVVTDFPVTDMQSSPQFNEQEFNEVDVGGTPMVTGKVTFPKTTKISSDEIKSKVVDFLNSKHPNLNISPESLDDSNIANGEVKFAISKGSMNIASSNYNFPIIVADENTKKK